jgi:hypothetical protein
MLTPARGQRLRTTCTHAIATACHGTAYEVSGQSASVARRRRRSAQPVLAVVRSSITVTTNRAAGEALQRLAEGGEALALRLMSTTRMALNQPPVM